MSWSRHANDASQTVAEMGMSKSTMARLLDEQQNLL